jgi:hypothetical protein
VKFIASLALAASLLLPAGAHAQSGKLDELGWLAGCWQRTKGERIVDEQWMAPRGGMMMGMGRTVQAGKVLEFESMRIFERGDSLVFAAQPSGQPASEFTTVAATKTAVTFANPSHDFPQRVMYSLGTADSLFARIEGVLNGQPRGVDFKLKRVACGA